MPDAPTINETNNKKFILFILLIIINLVLMIFYFSIPFELPETSDLEINTNTLIHNIYAKKISQGLNNDSLFISPDLDAYSPRENLQTWKQNLPFYFAFPDSKIRSEIPLFKIKTNNASLYSSGTITLDSMYPPQSLFGFSALNDFEEKIFRFSEHFYYFKGDFLIEDFIKKDKMFKPTYTKHLILSENSENLFLSDKSGITRNFSKYSDHGFRLTDKVDKFENIIRYEYNDSGQLIRIANQKGETITFEYNDRKNIILVKTSKSEWIFEYDSFQNLRTIKSSERGTIHLSHDSKTYPHLLTAIENSESKAELAYDVLGRLSQVKINSEPVRFLYGKNIIQILSGNKRHILDFKNEKEKSFLKDKTLYSYIYDDYGQITQYRENDYTLLMTYNSLGNLISKKDGADTYTYVYDDQYNLLKKISKNGHPILERFIHKGLITSENREDLGEIKYNYSEKGNLESLAIDNLGEYFFKTDNVGNITEVELPDKQSITFEWKNSKLMKYRDIFNQTYKFNYNFSGQLFEIISPEGNSNFNTHTFSSPMKNLAKIDNTLFHNLDIDYKNRSFSFLDPSHEKLSITLSPLRRITSIRGPNTGKKYQYYSNGQISRISFLNGEDIVLGTNDKNQLNHILAPEAAWTALEYDQNHLKNMMMDKEIRSFTYNERNQISSIKINTREYKYTYSPKDPGKLYTLTFPDQTQILYTYNAKGSLEAITFKNDAQIKFAHTANGACTIRYPNGILQNEEYDEEGRLTALSITDSEGQSIRESTYFFQDKKFIAGSDNSKRIKASYNAEGYLSEYSLQSIADMSYDFNKDTLQLLKMTKNKQVILYEKNKAASTLAIIDSLKQNPVSSVNLAGKIEGLNFNFLEINEIGQILDNNASDFTINNYPVLPGQNSLNVKALLNSGNAITQKYEFFLHPEASSILQFENNQLKNYYTEGAYSSYTWNTMNQISSFDDHKGEVFRYKYLPDGKRSFVSSGIKNILYIYDCYGNLIEETTATGSSLIKYVYDYQRGRLVMSFDGKKIRYYHTDCFGSVINVTDESGKSIADYAYSPYGQTLIKNESVQDNTIGYLGYKKDLETGCYHTPYGYYDPELPYLHPCYLSEKSLSPKLKDMIANNHILPLKPEQCRFTRSYETPAIPEAISFNKEFLWLDFLQEIPDSLVLLRKYLHQEKE